MNIFYQIWYHHVIISIELENEVKVWEQSSIEGQVLFKMQTNET